MTRLFPLPWQGLHPAYPAPPEPLAANPIVIATPLVGALSGVGAAILGALLRKPVSGWFLKGAAYGTVGSVAMGLRNYEMRERTEALVLLKEQGIEVPSRTLFICDGTFRSDDYIVAGCALGMLCMLSRRVVPTTVGWRRYVGGASLGGFVGDQLYTLANMDAVYTAVDTYKRQIEQSITIRKQLAEKHNASIVAQHIESVSPSAEEPQLEDSGGMPHCYTVDQEGNRKFLATTDYRWVPANPQEGIKILEEHLKTLTSERAKLASETEFLWYELAQRENASQNITDDKARTIARKSLELLGSTHSNLWKEISDLDWMIADTKKRILQLQAKQRGSTWVPAPGSVNRSKYLPAWSLDRFKKHLSNMEQIVAASDALLGHRNFSSLPKKTQQEVQEQRNELLGNIEATKALIEEFETRVNASDAEEGKPAAKEP